MSLLAFVGISAVGLSLLVIGQPTDVTTTLGDVGSVLWGVGAVLASLFVFIVLVARRVRPAGDVLRWAAARVLAAWQRLDGGSVPTTDAEALGRLERSTAAEPALRIGSLVAAGRLNGAGVVLESWSPVDELGAAHRARLAAALAFARGTDDLAPADAAVRMIPEERARREQEALLELERARRLSLKGQDPIPTMARARRQLGTVDLHGLGGRSSIRRRLPLGVTAVPLAAWLLSIFVLYGPLAYSLLPSTAGDRVVFSPAAIPAPSGSTAAAAIASFRSDAWGAIESGLSHAVDLKATGDVGADTVTCDLCVTWWPYGRRTEMPPNPRGDRVYRVTVLLGDAVVGRGPAIAEVWFVKADPAERTRLRAAGTSDTTPSYRYRLDADTTLVLDTALLGAAEP